ncbi:MAG: Alkanesulfonate monooxygenase [Frankiales bacterium]|jgi:FMNH2-dependent dimethyl sulfone monooxygenase|nr:Alkanesulfonate monooxygenase [Frankiales bacterium]
MRFGYWMPVFGGWLRNVRDEQMSVDWAYLKALAVESEQAGFDLSLIAELNLNDIKGHRAPALDAWTLAPAVAAVTERLELMLAVRPNYHSPSLTAKAVSTLDTIAPGRTSLNVVSSWWKDEATQYGAPFDVHDARYERTDEWLEVFSRLMVEDEVTHAGPRYALQGCVLQPKPAVPPTVYMGGESRKAKEVISRRGSAYVMHGDPPDVIAEKVRDMNARAAEHGRTFQYGVSGYVIVRDSEAEAQDELARILDVQADPEAYASYQDFLAGSQLESQVSLEEYSVSNRGLRAGLVGTPAQVIERIRAYEQAGVDLMLLQFSPQREEMARFGRDVISAY